MRANGPASVCLQRGMLKLCKQRGESQLLARDCTKGAWTAKRVWLLIHLLLKRKLLEYARTAGMTDKDPMCSLSQGMCKGQHGSSDNLSCFLKPIFSHDYKLLVGIFVQNV